MNCPRIIEIDGVRWKVRAARSRRDALDAIGFARATGSVGAYDTLDETLCGGGKTVLANVVQINSDYTERQPYTMGY